MSELPPELLHEILVRLPPDDLIRCLAVSKPWNSFVLQPSFIKSHLRRSLQTESDRIMVLLTRSSKFGHDAGKPSTCFCALPFEDDDDTLRSTDLLKPLKSTGDDFTYRISSSFHGLLCLINHQRNLFALWNPSIQKFKTIPFPTTNTELPKSQSACYGFGYDSVNDDYKVVYITFTAEYLVTNVYSLKHNSWKAMIQNNMHHCCHDGLFWDFEEALFSGGAVCWMMRKQLDDGRQKYVILTFNLATEEYVEFRTPVDVYQLSRPTLVVLGGLLCICVFYPAGVGGRKLDVWIMKEYGVPESWTLLCSMVDSYLRGPLAFSKDRERLLLVDSLNNFYWYDLGEKQISRQVDNPDLKDCYKPTICVRSLCLLDGDPVIR